METIDQIYECMSSERVNCDVVFVDTESEGVFINIRLRPWKGGRRADSMVLACGRTMDEALYYAYVALFQGIYIPQDWSARTVSPGYVSDLGQTSTGKNATKRLEVDPGASFSAFMASGSNSSKNGAHGAPQSDSEPIRLTGRNMPKN